MRVKHTYNYALRAKLKRTFERHKKVLQEDYKDIRYATNRAKWLIEQKFADKVTITVTGEPK